MASMTDNTKDSSKRNQASRGFSLIELVVVLGVILVVTAVGVPSFLQAYRSYQLNDAATRVAGVLKFARYEAIRQNKPISTLVRAGSTSATENLWVDANGDSTEQATENQIVLQGPVNLVASGTPPRTTALALAVGVSTLTSVSLSSGTLTFDQRGAITPAAVNVIYVGNTAIPTLGYRAVILLPSGSVQIWSSDNSGTWHQLI